MGWLTAFLSDTIMALVEDGALFETKAPDMGISLLRRPAMPKLLRLDAFAFLTFVFVGSLIGCSSSEPEAISVTPLEIETVNSSEILREAASMTLQGEFPQRFKNETLKYIGLFQVRSGDIEGALITIDSLSDFDRRDSGIDRQIMLSYLKMGDFESVIDRLNVRPEPWRQKYYGDLATAYAEMGNLDESQRYIELVEEKNRDRAAHMVTSRLLTLGKINDAISWTEKMEIEPSRSQMALARIRFPQDQDDYEGQMAIARAIPNENADDLGLKAIAFSTIASIQLREGNFEGGNAAFREAIDIWEGPLEALKCAGCSSFARDDNLEVIASYQFLAGDTEGGIKTLMLIGHLPSVLESIFRIAELQIEFGQEERALATLDVAQEFLDDLDKEYFAQGSPYFNMVATLAILKATLGYSDDARRILGRADADAVEIAGKIQDSTAFERAPGLYYAFAEIAAAKTMLGDFGEASTLMKSYGTDWSEEFSELQNSFILRTAAISLGKRRMANKAMLWADDHEKQMGKIHIMIGAASGDIIRERLTENNRKRLDLFIKDSS